MDPIVASNLQAVEQVVKSAGGIMFWQMVKIVLWIAPIAVFTIIVKEFLLSIASYLKLRTKLSVDSHYIIEGQEGILKEIRLGYLKLVERFTTTDAAGVERKLLKIWTIPYTKMPTFAKVAEENPVDTHP